MTTIHLTDAQRDTFAACGLVVVDGVDDNFPGKFDPVGGWRDLDQPCDTCGGEVLLSGKFGVDPLGLKVCPDCRGGRRVATLTATCRWCEAKAINHPHKEAGHEGVVTLGRFTIPALAQITEVWPEGANHDRPCVAVQRGAVLYIEGLDPLPRPGQFVVRPEAVPT